MQIPMTFYHLTPAENLDEILSQGIRLDKKILENDIFLTSTISTLYSLAPVCLSSLYGQRFVNRFKDQITGRYCFWKRCRLKCAVLAVDMSGLYDRMRIREHRDHRKQVYGKNDSVLEYLYHDDIPPERIKLHKFIYLFFDAIDHERGTRQKPGEWTDGLTIKDITWKDINLKRL